MRKRPAQTSTHWLQDQYIAVRNRYVRGRPASILISSPAGNYCFLFAEEWVGAGVCKPLNFSTDNTTLVIIRKYSRKTSFGDAIPDERPYQAISLIKPLL